MKGLGGSYRTGRGSGRFGTAHPAHPHHLSRLVLDRRQLVDIAQGDGVPDRLLLGAHSWSVVQRRLAVRCQGWTVPQRLVRATVSPVWPARILPPGRGLRRLVERKAAPVAFRSPKRGSCWPARTDQRRRPRPCGWDPHDDVDQANELPPNRIVSSGPRSSSSGSAIVIRDQASALAMRRTRRPIPPPPTSPQPAHPQAARSAALDVRVRDSATRRTQTNSTNSFVRPTRPSHNGVVLCGRVGALASGTSAAG